MSGQARFDCRDTLRVPDVVLRSGAQPSIDARDPRRPGCLKNAADIAHRYVDELIVR